mgnify:CR=1 FL=1
MKFPYEDFWHFAHRVGNFCICTRTDEGTSLEELAEEGLIRADPDSGFEEFPAGLLLTVEDSIERTGDTPFRSRNTAPAWGPTVSMTAPPGRRGTAGAMPWGRR